MYGDTVTVSGTLAVPQPFMTDTGHMFDYAGYLSVQGVSVMMPQAPGSGLRKGDTMTAYFQSGSVKKRKPRPTKLPGRGSPQRPEPKLASSCIRSLRKKRSPIW